MKKLLNLVFFSLILMNRGAGVWQQLGPQGVNIRAFGNVPGYPDELFIISGWFPSYLYHTGNAGSTWAVRETFPDIISALAINPRDVRVMFAGGRTGKIYRSTNSGYTWFTVGMLPAGSWVRQLALNPQNGSEIWALAEVTAGDSAAIAVFNSTDGGVNWQLKLRRWSYEAQANCLVINPVQSGNIIICGALTNRPVLLISTDSGASWLNRTTGLSATTVNAVSFVPTLDSALLCATDSGIFYSSDFGRTWDRRLIAPVWSIAVAPVFPYYAYAGGENLVYRSSDLGFTWRTDTNPDFTGSQTRFLAINPVRPLELYAANGYGVFLTTNGGYTWTVRTSGFYNLDCAFINLYGTDTLFAAVDGYWIVRSADGGRNWQQFGKMFPGVGGVKWMAVNRIHPDTVVCVTGDGKFHLSINRGDSWNTYPIADNFQAAGIAYHPRATDTLYSWGGKRDSVTGPSRFAIYRSIDRGQHWTPLLLRDAGMCYGFFASSGGDTLIAWGGNRSGPAVFRSIDRGRNWSPLVNGINGSPILDLKIFPAEPGRWLCATPAGVFRTDNYGATWTNLGLTGVTCVLPDTINPNYIWAGTDTQGFFWTTNQGVSWWRDTLGVPGRSVSILLSHPQRRSAVYAGIRGHSLFGKNVIGIGESAADYSGSSVRVSISPVVVKGGCRIIVQPVPERVELYDAAGRRRVEVRLDRCGIVNWQRPAALEAGVYLLVARTQNRQLTRKLLLLPWQ
ncbi:MAG: WD40/YVTN/BNR-like repeat-containing protein [candidate division WOR-3 bacterium]|jgi:photosystem II stability/assembly factor-like uncharacterized protein